MESSTNYGKYAHTGFQLVHMDLLEVDLLKKKFDIIISNPPYSLARKFILHSFKFADNIVYLLPAWKAILPYGLVKAGQEFGGIKEIRWYGTGTRLNFPTGNGIGAVYWKKDYRGQMAQSFYEEGINESR